MFQITPPLDGGVLVVLVGDEPPPPPPPPPPPLLLPQPTAVQVWVTIPLGGWLNVSTYHGLKYQGS